MASHRRYTSSPAPVTPQVEINGAPTAPDAAISVEIPDDAAQYEQEIPKHDEATAVLKRQIEALEQSEALQRQHQERQHAHTAAMNQLAEYASRTAAEQGHKPGSAEHLNRAREIFGNHLRDQAAAQQTAANPAPAPQPVPRPSLAPLPESPPSTASIYSAPVSRQEAGNYNREPSPSSVRLSAEEREIARGAGISDLQYAKNKLEMMRRQRAGEIQK